ncbi:hypothetical protein B0T18DRAFT_7762 [Schizothecium vesticola]|uniref:Uncharacterized protein n=1 Tax=Schizothecium vesticola TaxID=314040 RepID=A0AA40F8P0_9PEZI|nr:hypothetical protein B0T18DRAFT_7762 [Schizothecium vesticola]
MNSSGQTHLPLASGRRRFQHPGEASGKGVLACFSSCFDPASTIHNPCPISGCKGVCTSSLGFLLSSLCLCAAEADLMQRRSNNLARQRLREQAERRPTHWLLFSRCGGGSVSIAAAAGRSAIVVAWRSGFPMLVVESTRVELVPPADSRIEMAARGPRIPAAISLSLYSLRMRSCWKKHKAYCGDSLSPTGTSMLRRNSRRRSETDRRPAQVGSSLSRQTTTQ